MTYHPETRGHLHALPKSEATWVHEALEPDQLSNAKQPYERRVLDRKTILLLWGLRVYVLLMVVLIGAQIWNAFHSAG